MLSSVAVCILGTIIFGCIVFYGKHFLLTDHAMILIKFYSKWGKLVFVACTSMSGKLINVSAGYNDDRTPNYVTPRHNDGQGRCLSWQCLANYLTDISYFVLILKFIC